jgi:tetratricopeptide (TPR) repeat protein
MKAEQYLMKAEMLLKRDLFDKVIETLETALEKANEENNFVDLLQANCFLSEAYFMQNQYEKAREYLTFVQDNSDEAENHDDLLSQEIYESDLLLSLLDKYNK